MRGKSTTRGPAFGLALAFMMTALALQGAQAVPGAGGEAAATPLADHLALPMESVPDPGTVRPIPPDTVRLPLHAGTYPVRPPPGLEDPREQARQDLRINVDREGRVLSGDDRRPSGSPAVPLGSGGGPEPLATVDHEGVFQYEDRELNEGGFTGTTWMAPVRRADVEFYDIDSGTVLGTASTNDTGYFRMQVTDTVTRNVSFRALTTTLNRPGLFNASVTQLPSRGGQPYALVSPTYANHDPANPISFVTQPVNATSGGVGGPFHIFDLAESAERYVQNMTSDYPDVNLTVYWSSGYNEGKYYDTFGHVYLPGGGGDDDSYDDNIILHEIGHYITMSYSTEAGFYGAHGLAGIVDIRLAYVEALGSYFMGAIRNYLGVPQPLIYIETDGTSLSWFGFSLSYDTDTPSSYSNGDFTDTTAANEVADAHAIYDVVDGITSPDGTAGTDDDALDLPFLAGDRLVWDVLISIRENASLFTKEITMETFFDQWLLVNPGYASEFTQILVDAGIEYAADTFEDDDTAPTAAGVLPDGTLGHRTFFPAGDEDWATFPAVADEEYVIKTQDLLDGADTVLELYDADGTTLLAANNDRDASTRASLLTVTATAPQPYFVRVYRYAETPTPIGEYGKYNLTVYILPNPDVLSVNPSTGPVAGGTAVTITGSNFTAGATVLFGVYEAVGLAVLDASTITATTPANVPGIVDVTVVSPPNPDALVPRGTLTGGFTYTGSPLPPGVRSLTPDFGSSSLATAVTVSGDYFLPGAILEFDAILIASYTVVDPKTIAATVQPLPVAVYDVTVTNPGGLSDTLANGYESASTASASPGSTFVSGSPLSTSLSITDDYEIMDLHVYANITHPQQGWPGVRIELRSPGGRTVKVFDRIEVADATGTVWRTHINSTFGYDEAPSEVLWQFRGERTVGTWTLNLSSVLDSGVPSTLHSWALTFFRYRHKDISRIVLTAGLYRNYVTGFDEDTGEQLYRVRLQAKDPDYFAPYPNPVAVTRDRRHVCGAGFSDYNSTRAGWTDSTVTCFELMTGKAVRTFFLSGNLGIDGLEAPRDADRMVAATNEFIYLIDTTTLQIVGQVPTGFPPGAGPPSQGITPDGRKAYITNASGQEVLVVDLDALGFVGQIDVAGYTPLDVDVSADGTFGLISTGAPSALHRFDAATDTIIDLLPVDGLQPFQTVLTPDGTKAFYGIYQYYAGFGRTDLVSQATTRFFPHPESTTEALAIGADGTLYVADWYVSHIWIYSSSTEVLLKDIVVPDHPYLTGTDVGEVVERPALSAFGGDAYVDLTWSTPPSLGTPVQGYTIYRGTSAGEEERYAAVGTVNNYVDLGVVNGQTYYYRIAASNVAGQGAWSNEVSATPNAYFPVISNVAAAPDPQSVGGPVNLTATVTDVPPLAGVWVNVTDPLAGTTNSSMARVGATDVFYFEAPYGMLGPHSFVVAAVNVDGHWSMSGASTFTIITDTTPPEITEVLAAPDPQSVGGAVNITARVTDDTIPATVWANVSLPGGGFSNGTMARVGASEYFYRNATYGLPGIHTFAVGADDLAGNTNSSSGHSFLIVDATVPVIANVQDSPDPQEVGGPVNITATVTDDVGVVEVRVNVTLPGGGTANTSLTRVGLTDDYFHEQPYGALGTHTYRVVATDATGNWAASPPFTFEVIDSTLPVIVNVLDTPDPQGAGGAVNITATVTDNVQVAEVRANITLPGGGTTNLSMTQVGATATYFLDQSYGALGLYAYLVWAVDTSANANLSTGHAFLIVDATPPSITGVLDSPDPQQIGGAVNITATVTDDVGVVEVRVNVSLPGGGIADTPMVRIGLTDDYYLEATYGTLGGHAYRVLAADGGGNWAASAPFLFTVVDTIAPGIALVLDAPDPQEVGGPVNVTATVTDSGGVSEVWLAVTLPGSGSTNTSMSRIGLTDVYSLEQPYYILGTHTYRVVAADAGGNWAASPSFTFTMIDSTPPAITGVLDTPDPQALGGAVNITATVTDNVQVTEVRANITLPGGGFVDAPLTRIGLTDGYYLEQPYTAIGTYAYLVLAVDSSGNVASSPGHSFGIVDIAPPAIANAQDSPDPQDVGSPVNITATVTDDVAVTEVWVNLTHPGGGTSNRTMARVGLTTGYFLDQTYGTLGTYAYTVWASDAAGNAAAAEGSFTILDREAPKLVGLQVTPPIQELPGGVNVSVDVTDNYALFPTVWIEIIDPLGTGTNLTMVRGAGDRWSFEQTYSALGIHTFTIWARDEAGNGNSTSGTFELRDTTPPVATAGPDQAVEIGDLAVFNGSGSTDGAGTGLNFTWVISGASTTVAVIYGPLASFTFLEVGTYTVTLTVTDASGNAGEDVLAVEVLAPPGDGGGWLLWLILLAIGVAVLLLLLYLYRRRKPAPSEPPATTEGTESAPVNEPTPAVEPAEVPSEEEGVADPNYPSPPEAFP